MAAPNIVGVTTIIGITTFAGITTNFSSILSNPANSNQVFKINTIIVSNVDGINNVDISVGLNNLAAGAGTTSFFIRTVSVPADSTLVVLGKDSPIYLEENRSITALASANNDADCIISYERIS